MHQAIPVIDIFAGPGGLAEGFSSFKHGDNNPFEVIMSVEKEEGAHATLRLRAFLRWFIHKKKRNDAPTLYVNYVQAQDLNEKKKPILLLGRILGLEPNELCIDREAPSTEVGTLIAATEERLAELFGTEWEKFSSLQCYLDDRTDIIQAVRYAIYEARNIELGSQDDEEAALFRPLCHQREQHLLDNPSTKHTILVGGPPCQAYSNVGRVRRSKGNVVNNIKEGGNSWTLEDDPRSWLYIEYLKLLDHISPAIFVMENVRGMLSAKFEDEEGNREHVWRRIIKDLHEPHLAITNSGKTSYTPTSNDKYIICSLVSAESCHYTGKEGDLENDFDPSRFVIKASDYGVPQNRERVILLGIRKDLVANDDIQSLFKNIRLNKNKIKPNVSNAIRDLPKQYSKLSGYFTSERKRPLAVKDDKENHSKWLEAIDSQLKNLMTRLSKMPPKSANDLFGKEEDFYQTIDDTLSDTYNAIVKGVQINGNDWIEAPDKKEDDQALSDWYQKIWRKKEPLNHKARGHMDTDLGRYAYAACYAIASRKTKLGKQDAIRDQINLEELEKVGLLPAHRNRKSFTDRFKVQRAESPASTITSHIAKDGHYYIHPDPGQCRSLTVREAARIQTFPDDYFFEGSRLQQYVQVGNAVPPKLANEIAKVVFNVWELVNLNGTSKKM